MSGWNKPAAGAHVCAQGIEARVSKWRWICGVGAAATVAALLVLLTVGVVGAQSEQPAPPPLPPDSGQTVNAIAPPQPTDVTGVPPYAEYEKKVRAAEQVTPLTSELFGETLSPYLGQAEFSQVDIDLRGNSALPVQLRRRFVVSALTEGALRDPKGGIGNPYGGAGNWDVDVPYIYGIFDATNKWNIPSGMTSPAPRCSGPFTPGTQSGFSLTEVWSGNKVHIPGQGDLGVIRLDSSSPPLHAAADGQVHTWTTSRFDSFTCTSTSNGFGEGFVMTTPEGTTYTFDVYLERWYGGVSHGSGPGEYAPRLMIFLLASKVTDRNGNWVKYFYDAAGHPWAITSNDGRQISLAYNPGDPSQLQTATVTLSEPAQTRTWRYGYQSSPKDHLPQLTSVTLPDNSQWGYTYSNTDYLYVRYTPLDAPCRPATVNASPFTLGITHPSGAQGTFQFQLVRHNRTLPSYPPNCQNNQYTTPPYVDTFSLMSKTITGAALPSTTWAYSYDIDYCATCTFLKNRIQQPDGSVIESSFSKMYNATGFYAPADTYIEGQLLQTDVLTGLNGTVLQSTLNEYFTGKDLNNGQPFDGQPFPSRYGTTQGADDPASGSVRPLKSTKIILAGAKTSGATTFTRTNETFDDFARPLRVTRASSLGHSRTETTAYKDYLDQRWILGLTDSVKEATLPNNAMVENTYDAKGNLLTVTEFSSLKRSMTYRGDGTLATVQDGAGKTTTLGTFKLGVPQSVTYPDGRSQTAVVDDAGSIRSVTEASATVGGGAKAEYDYDIVGRLKKITYPTDAAVSWKPTTIDYVQTTQNDLGVTGSHWRQTTATGNATKIVDYDAFWRPVVTTEYDSANRSGTERRVTRTYDHANRELFVSYPRDPLGRLTAAGTTTAYDALGRVKTVTQDAESTLGGSLVTYTAYLDGFKKQVTDPRGNVATTSFQVFDEPSENAPTQMDLPENVRVTIDRDLFGNPKTITRSDTSGLSTSSVVRSYYYDDKLRLCATVEPESGTTVQAYDGADNVSWMAKGLLPVSQCDRTAAKDLAKINFDYDARNRRTGIRYPAASGTPNASWSYYPNGRLQSATTNGASWSYTYYNRGLLASESLSYDGQTLMLDYTYDANGFLTKLDYPDDTSIDFAPNALGQPTQAGAYATAVKYYPNGAMKSFTYGNAIAHSLTQNTRQLPLQSKDGAAVDLTYAYDANANVASITDGLAPATQTRGMQYDGLNRLTKVDAASAWGTATFTYDLLDNLTRSVVGIRDCTHTPDGSNRLSRLSGPNCATLNYSYDARGNATARGNQRFVFDQADRMTSAERVGDVGSKENYTYDAHGHRVRVLRASDNGKLFQVYSQAGQLLYAKDSATGKTTNYVYLNGSLVARLGEVFDDGNNQVPAVPGVPTLTPPEVSLDGNYTVAWALVQGASKYTLLESVNGGPALQVQRTDETLLNWTAANRTAGRYTYQVRACNDNGCSDPGATATEVVVRTPANLTVTPASPIAENTPYTVRWDAVSTAGSYRLDELVNGNWTVAYAGSYTSLPVDGRAAGTYTYRIAACYGTACTATSATLTVTVASLPPCQPTGLNVPANSTTGVYTVGWTPCSGAAYYNVQERYNSDPWGAPVRATGGAWSPDPKTRSGTYAYQVAGCNSSGSCTAPVAPVSVQVTVPNDTPPAAPGTPTIVTNNGTNTTSTDGVYTVSWAPVTNAVKYVLYEAVNAGALVQVAEGASPSWTVPSNASKPGGTYGYQVSACNAYVCSAPGPGRVVWVLRTPASLMSNLYQVPVGASFLLSWSDAGPALSYEVEEKVGSGNWTALSPVGQLVLRMDRGVGTYQYRVRACRQPYCTGYSPIITVTVSALIPQPPARIWAVPTPPQSSSDGNYTVSWESSASATYYKLEVNLNNTGYQLESTVPVPQWSPSPPKSISGTYKYQVSACNDAGCSSPMVGATVMVSIPTTVGVPTGLQACRTGGGGRNCASAGGTLTLHQQDAQAPGFRVSWNAASNATSYTYTRKYTTGCGGAAQTTTVSTPVTYIDGGATVPGTCGWVEEEYVVTGCAGATCSAPTAAVTVRTEKNGAERPTRLATYIHTDGLGSPIAETDGSGQVTARMSYEPYGTLWGSTGTGPVQGPGYAGHVADKQTKLSYMQQRYYDPLAGRFLSVDPVAASAGSFNRYWYANNNPYTNRDSNGEICTYAISDNEICDRSLRYEALDSDPRISGKTRFFGAASMVTNALGSQKAGDFMAALSAKLEGANEVMAGKILRGQIFKTGTTAEHDAEFVHYEQSMVQRALDDLKEKNSSLYDKIISEANSALNGPLSAITSSTDPNFSKALTSAKASLGGTIDFAKQGDRETLGRAAAAVARSSRQVCTGSHIRKC